MLHKKNVKRNFLIQLSYICKNVNLLFEQVLHLRTAPIHKRRINLMESLHCKGLFNSCIWYFEVFDSFNVDFSITFYNKYMSPN